MYIMQVSFFIILQKLCSTDFTIEEETANQLIGPRVYVCCQHRDYQGLQLVLDCSLHIYI